MQITISGIDVLVEKKNIKNMHLYVKPPLGKVSVSAPIVVSEKSIENFVRLNLGWIKKQQEKYINQPRKTERQYISGETYFTIFGISSIFLSSSHQIDDILKSKEIRFCLE